MWLMVESNHRLCYQGSAPLADALPVELISRVSRQIALCGSMI